MTIATCAFKRLSILRGGSRRGTFHSRNSCFPMRSTAFCGMLPGYERTRQPQISSRAVSVLQENDGGLVSRAFSNAFAPFRQRIGAGRIALPGGAARGRKLGIVGVRSFTLAEPLQL